MIFIEEYKYSLKLSVIVFFLLGKLIVFMSLGFIKIKSLFFSGISIGLTTSTNDSSFYKSTAVSKSLLLDDSFN